MYSLIEMLSNIVLAYETDMMNTWKRENKIKTGCRFRSLWLYMYIYSIKQVLDPIYKCIIYVLEFSFNIFDCKDVKKEKERKLKLHV